MELNNEERIIDAGYWIPDTGYQNTKKKFFAHLSRLKAGFAAIQQQ
jgi:hypothetical protein